MRLVTATVLLLIGAFAALLVERVILTPDLFNPIITFIIDQEVLYTHILGPVIVGIILSLWLVPVADFVYWKKKRNLDLEHAKLIRLQEIASSTSEALERVLYSENQLRRISPSEPRHAQFSQMNAEANALLMKNRIMLESYFSQPTADALGQWCDLYTRLAETGDEARSTLSENQVSLLATTAARVIGVILEEVNLKSSEEHKHSDSKWQEKVNELNRIFRSTEI